MGYDVLMPETGTPTIQSSDRTHRLIGLIVAVCCSAPLILAATLTPSPSGLGTHTQLRLPSCGFKTATGLPCATCGCTTAFAYAADGSLLKSLVTQPFGALLALALAMMTLVGLWSAWSAMPLNPLGSVMGTKTFVLGWVGLLLAAWAYKAALIAVGG